MSDLIFLAIILIGSFLFFRLKRRFQYWEKRGVPYLKAQSLIFGNDSDVVFGRIALPDIIQRNYNELAPHRFGGVFSFYNPILYIRDPELVGNILTKDFNYFVDRGHDFVNKDEPLTMHLFNLNGDEWKLMRARLTHTFTPGKMKLMFDLVRDCADELKSVIMEKIKHDEAVEVKDIMARFTTDVISSCAFGLQTNSLKNPDSEFRKMGRKVFTPTLRTQVRDMLFQLNPSFTKRITRNFSADVTSFFNKVVQETIEYRTKNNICRNDFLNLLMELLNGENKGHTNKDKFDFSIDLLVAQCFVFFLAGFETTSNVLSFTLYELARHPNIKKKLQSEIDRVLNERNGQITYEALQEMTYMDCVINESMRLYPAISFLVRTCVSDYPVSNSRNFVIKKDEVLFIPLQGLHRDPQYFPKPNDFYPERFSIEARSSIPSFCFLPFGEGPRICIGMRFGSMNVKVALAVLLRNFDFTMSSNMNYPVTFKKHSVLTTTESEILLKFQHRRIIEEKFEDLRFT